MVGIGGFAETEEVRGLKFEVRGCCFEEQKTINHKRLL
jgi:hypothetical protein